MKSSAITTRSTTTSTTRSPRHVAIACGATLVFALSACTSNDDGVGVSGTSNPASVTTSGSSGASGLDLTAHVDPDNASVTLPSDRLFISDAEERLLMSAHDVALAECVRGKGIAWDFPAQHPVDDPVLNAWHRYGPWTADIAQRFAFVKPQTETSLIRNGIVVPAAPAVPATSQPESLVATIDNLSEEQLAASRQCEKDPQVLEFGRSDIMTATPWQSEIAEGTIRAEADPRGLQLFEELGNCYAEQGMEMDPEQPGFVVGARQYAVTREMEVSENCRADGPAGGDDACGMQSVLTGESAINEAQIALALTTVQCKDSINFTQRIADLIAEKEAPIVEEYAEDIVADRQRVDDLLAQAKAYNAAHPDAFLDAE